MQTAHSATSYIPVANLQVARPLYDLVVNEITPGTGIEPSWIWNGLSEILADLTPLNDALLAERDALQAKIDAWHRQHRNERFDQTGYHEFLIDIGYVLPACETFSVNPLNVDEEIATIAGPQLVVPVNNARYALNAANARWGSLFDALYGTDALGDGVASGKGFDPARGRKVVDYSMALLDDIAPLTSGSHADVIHYLVYQQSLYGMLYTGEEAKLKEPEKFIGYRSDGTAVSAVLLRHHGLHVEISIEETHDVCTLSRACVRDLIMEAAITTIQDCEDSVAAVDAEDKTAVYRNWLQLMKGELHTSFTKNGSQLERRLNPDRTYLSPDGTSFTLPGRSLMLIRNVGLHMKTDAVLNTTGEEIYEGILDCLITACCAVHDLQGRTALRNSRTGSIYIVKPKLHGPKEVAFTVQLMDRVEQCLRLPANTIKIGIMDEERRTSVNLRQCLYEARERVIFINTGFLDRTGDEIHTSMEAGPMWRKEDMKAAPWLLTYEEWNVAVGLECGLLGKGQIGKGMWTKPDNMHAMLQGKQQHLLAGASCAWVPSPSAATLHAIHYHQVNVQQRQHELLQQHPVDFDRLLIVPVVDKPHWTATQIHDELENNLQGILGYVVRWIEQGIGASKVPDINHVNLMEDRATLRISSQHVANWLLHGIVSETQVHETLKQMAAIVDEQNVHDAAYVSMAPGFDGPAFNAAQELIFRGRELPNGYTIPVLSHWRRLHKYH